MGELAGAMSILGSVFAAIEEKDPAQLAKEYVDRGFARITGYYGGSRNWMRLIEFDRLYVSLASHCVLKQVFGDYEAGLAALGLYMGDNEIVRHGFCTHMLRGLDDDVLREAWRAKITQELAA